MKILLVLIFTFIGLVIAGVPDQPPSFCAQYPFYLENQAQLDEFTSSCADSSDLNVGVISFKGLKDLSALSSFSIQTLVVAQCPDLASIDALSLDLTSLQLYSLPMLTSIVANNLTYLQSVGIHQLDALNSVDLTGSPLSYLSVSDCPVLSTISYTAVNDTLNALTMDIYDCPKLNSLSYTGQDPYSLTFLSLQNLASFNTLKQVFSMLEYFPGYFFLDNLPSLTGLDGLPSDTQLWDGMGDLLSINNTGIVNLANFNPPFDEYSNITISNNPALSSIDSSFGGGGTRPSTPSTSIPIQIW